MRPEDWRQSTHFQASEFSAPDHMGYEFLLWLNAVRDKAGVPMTITSSYRTPAHNVAVGGAEDSAHCDVPCNAVDIAKQPTPDDPHWNLARGKIMRAAIGLGCVRLGFYPNGSLHLDRSDRVPAIWNAVDSPAH